MTKNTDYIEWLKKDLSFDYMSGYEKLLAKRAWQAAQTDQAEYIAMLELNNKFKDDRIAQLEIQNALYADDELVLWADRDMFINEIKELQLDNEKMRMALEACARPFNAGEVIRISKEALSITTQPESVVKDSLTVQKPVGVVSWHEGSVMGSIYPSSNMPKDGDKLYTHPIVRNYQTVQKPLNDEAIDEIEAQCIVYWTNGTGYYFDYKAFARAIEKSHGIGE